MVDTNVTVKITTSYYYNVTPQYWIVLASLVPLIIGLVEVYRKPWISPLNMGFSCKLSLNQSVELRKLPLNLLLQRARSGSEAVFIGLHIQRAEQKCTLDLRVPGRATGSRSHW